MAKIIVNGEEVVNGHLTVSRNKRIVEGNEEIVIEGILQCHIYFEEINELATPRLKLIGVDVFTETFGSDDYLMTYAFVCEDIDFSGTYVNSLKAYSYLNGDEMKSVESIMFKDECPILGGIGKEYLGIVEIEKESDKAVEEEAK